MLLGLVLHVCMCIAGREGGREERGGEGRGGEGREGGREGGREETEIKEYSIE